MGLKLWRGTRRTLATAALVLAAFPAFGGAASGGGPGHPSAPAGPKRVILVSWDGAADWVVDRMLAEGKLPNVARLVSTGVRAEAMRPAWPSKTACGHAAIWTGAYADVNGISGNWVPVLPRDQHTLLEDRSGYHSTALQAEPIWISAARAGKKVVVLSATHTFPAEPTRKAMADAGVPDDRLRTFSGFEAKLAPAEVLTSKDLTPVASGDWALPAAGAPGSREFVVDVAQSRFYGLVFDDPEDPAAGLDTVLIRQGSRRASDAVAESKVKPREAAEGTAGYSERFRVAKDSLFGFTYFRLFELAGDGSRMTLYRRGVHALHGVATKDEIEAYMSAYGGFHDEIFFSLYENRDFGPVIWDGGDGTAERRVIESVRFDVELRKRAVRYAMATWNPDLVVHYTPTTDSAGHSWVGALDPAAKSYDPGLAAKLWPLYEQVFQLEDQFLGALIDAAGPNGVVCLVSDHGMAATDSLFFPNVVLEQAGLVARSGKKIDLERTQVCVPPWSDFFVAVNGTDRKGGTVKPEDRENALLKAEAALLAVRDPRNGKPIVRAVFRPEEATGLGIGGVAGGDLYFELTPGYYPMSRLASKVVEPDESRIGSGNHGFFPFRRSMQAVCIMGGAGLAVGRSIGPIRQIDVAPTVSLILGIPPPRDARGHAIADVLQ